MCERSQTQRSPSHALSQLSQLAAGLEHINCYEQTNSAGEVGTLEEAAMNDLYDTKIFMRIADEGKRYLGTLLFDDGSFYRDVFFVLQRNIGKPIKEIGDLDLAHML
jgi:hypothetical protein